MRSVQTLIDEAIKHAGGRTALARKLSELGPPVSPQRVTNWANGHEYVSPETVGQLCDLLQIEGDEARRLLAVSIVQNPKNAKRATVLRRAFFVSWVYGIGVALMHPSNADATPMNADQPNLTVTRSFTSATQYTLSRMRNAMSSAWARFLALMARCPLMAIRPQAHA
jgi:hypothetical protein